MNSGMISVRYAKALLACAEERHVEKVIFDLMTKLADNILRHTDFMQVLKNPILADQDKKQLIVIAAGNVSNDLFLQFVDLVLKNKREDQLQRMALSYCNLFQKKSKICIGRITTAKPLNQKTNDNIRAFLQKWSDQEVELTTRTNPELIGGFIIDVGDERLDASLHRQLQQVKKNLVH